MSFFVPLRALLVPLLLYTFTGVAGAQGFPEKPITMVVPFPAGGSADIIARSIAEHMTGSWKQNVLVANRARASGNIGTETVVRAAPDGYTLLYGTVALASSPAVYPKLGWTTC